MKRSITTNVAPLPPNIASGSYFYTSSQNNNSTTSNTLGVGTLRVTPWYVPRGVSIARLGVEFTGAGEAGSLFRIGVYADNGSALPGALLLDAGTVSAASVAKVETTVSLTLAAGFYWIGGAVQNVVTTQPTVICTAPSYTPPMVIAPHAPTGFTLSSLNGTVLGVNAASVTGSLPSSFTSTGSTASVPRIIARVA